MSTIEFLFHEPSAQVERLSAPKPNGGGRYSITATLSVHLDAGDRTIGRLDHVLPCLSDISDHLAELDRDAPVTAIKMSTRPTDDEVRVGLREYDGTADAVVEDGAELVATARVRAIQATVDAVGVAVAVGLEFDVRADQVAQLVRLLGSRRAQARSEQLELLPAVPRAVAS